ncbi:MAG: hypothetical protein HZA46_04970 [Planctomycetales bacterium]|nr:hypothetical protein [Planctomycetales bacterium]
MARSISDSRVVWLVVGLMAGLGIATFWPHEPALASATDRTPQFAMATASVNPITPLEGVFVLDFLTGTIRGAVLNEQSAVFTQFYFRDLAQDFKVDPKSEPSYSMVTGVANINSRPGFQASNSVIYIAELSSGTVRAYGFPYTVSRVPQAPVQMVLLNSFPFRQAQEK